MSKPMHRSKSFKKIKVVTRVRGHVVHYKRAKPSLPHCAICKAELNGISLNRTGGKSRRTNSRQFGGCLCGGCVAEVVKLGSRVEQGEIKLNEVGIKHRAYVLQLVSH